MLSGERDPALAALVQALSLEGPVERIETQISTLFLTPAQVWKVKRPVRLSFIDYSTLERRAQFCTREVAVNRLMAAPIYLGVAALTAAGPGPIQDLATQAGLQEPALDWAVVMLRFEESARFDHLLAAGRLGRAEILDLAEVVAAAHNAAAPGPGLRLAAQIRQNVLSIGGELQRLSPMFGAERVARLQGWTLAEMARLSPLLESRGQAGRCRACHGDLHLQNIVLHHGRPMPFDAIEFNDDLSLIDTRYDIAFTAMDLQRRGHPDLAQILLAEHARLTEDPDGDAVMPLYLSMRARIRAMVAADVALGAPSDAEAQAWTAEALALFALAERVAGL